MAIPYLTSRNELQEYTSQCEALILYFTATWCGPCRAIAPVLEQLYNSYTNVEIVKVDLDSHRPLASQYQIAAVPTFVILHKGNEVERVRGANVEEVFSKVKALSELAPQGKRRAVANADGTSSTVDTSGSGPLNGELSQYIGKGFTVLNKTVFFNEFESLNTIPLAPNDDVKNLIRIDSESSSSTSSVISDADSQLLLHLPLANVCKVSSILIKATDHANTQKPEKVKVWVNRSSIISFEDASSSSALHEEDDLQDSSWDSNGWYELKLKYVRFQKVTSLDLFIEGEDEDEHTVLDKVAIVGVDGESKTQAKLEKIGHDHD